MCSTQNNFQNNLDEKLIFYLSLARITFISCKEKNILSKKLDSYHSLALLSIEEIFKFLDKPVAKRAIWNGQANLESAKRSAFYCKKLGVSVLHNEDSAYPMSLKNIDDPPYLLFCRGNTQALSALGEEKCVSVVGTRKLTPFGKKAARDFAYNAVKDGCSVVSGLAYGADGMAHKGAVEAFFDEEGSEINTSSEEKNQLLGRTVAVLPSGIDQVVPSCHKPLAEKILRSGGCIVSEYEPGVETAKWHFVARNRIIAGLSPATIVIEAPPGSGSLITADFALDYGRDVFFHQAAVSQKALNVAEAVQHDLELRFAKKEVSKYKIENNIAKYLDAGAGIITSYDDYKTALSEMPGVRNARQALVQGELF